MIKISKAKISDAHKIRALEEKIWHEEVTNKYDMPMYIRFGYAFIAKDGDKIVGAIISYPTKRGEVYVCDWVVDEKYRRLGIGKKLYERLFKEVNGKSIVSFLDPDNAPTIKGHFKLGFVVANKIKNPYALNEGHRIFVRRTDKRIS